MSANNFDFPVNKFLDSSLPFKGGSFLQLLEASHLLTVDTGWKSIYFSNEKNTLPSFLKTHSYGEYIFDWAWADLYQRCGLSYYPKLIHALPFTPINANKIIGESHYDFSLLEASNSYCQENSLITGEHYLFIDEKLNKDLESLNFHKMLSIQYHWKNKWNSFDEFLMSLKKNRRKMIKKERIKVANYGLEIKHLKGSEITEEICNQIYTLYLSTIRKKNSYAYLNKAFFYLLPKYLKDSLKVVLAIENETIIAMSLFFEEENTLFGRYWGIDLNAEAKFPLLHFELCYYQGMDICFESNLALFEAGAQGEQKLWRGFEPVEILSAHKLKNKDMFSIVKDHLNNQNLEVQSQILELRNYLPFGPTSV